ncbi:hypothetical protein Tco_0928455 [Tanacetum coccineum]
MREGTIKPRHQDLSWFGYEAILRPTPLLEYPTRDFTISTSSFQAKKTIYTSLTLRDGFRVEVDVRVIEVDDVSLVDGVFDGAFGGEGEKDVVIGESVVVTSSSLEMLINSCLGRIMVSLNFLEGLEEEA